jgi:hypothetical protein
MLPNMFESPDTDGTDGWWVPGPTSPTEATFDRDITAANDLMKTTTD